MSGRLITISGPDWVGKGTASKLLAQVLPVPTTLYSFPEYQSWSGRLISAILQEQKFAIQSEGEGLWSFKQKKDPLIFQLLQLINKLEKQKALDTDLSLGNVVADRYDLEVLAYGLADGAPLPVLLSQLSCIRRSDLAIVLLGERRARPGETPDQNERNQEFQEKVAQNYQALATLFPDWVEVIHTTPLSRGGSWHPEDSHLLSKAESVHNVHQAICKVVVGRLGVEVNPMTLDQVEESLGR